MMVAVEDRSWGCSHGNYLTKLIVNGPTSVTYLDAGLMVDLEIPFHPGDYDLRGEVEFFCDCFQDYLRAAGDGEVQVPPPPTTISLDPSGTHTVFQNSGDVILTATVTPAAMANQLQWIADGGSQLSQTQYRVGTANIGNVTVTARVFDTQATTVVQIVSPPPPPPPPDPYDPQLVVSPTSVTRGTAATFQLQDAGSGVSVTAWWFVGDVVGRVDRDSNTSQLLWTGTIVDSGTATIRFTRNGEQYERSARITVSARNFTPDLATPQEVLHSTSWGCSDPPRMPIPVANVNGGLGKSCLEAPGDFDVGTIDDRGPNRGVKWVTRTKPTNPFRWMYRWVIHPHADDLNCAFSTQQSGSYHPINNPTGWISGVNLRNGIRRHEAGAVSSHYAMYRVAATQANPAAQVEARLAPPATSRSAFENTVINDHRNVLTTVQTNTREPQPFDVDRDEFNVRQGYVNFAPYGPGCPP